MGHPFYDIIFQYGLYAVFVLAAVEGDVTLLLAGVMAHSRFFGDYSFPQVLLAGTLGGVVSDNVAYFIGRLSGKTVNTSRFYRLAQPRIQRLTDKFGTHSIFLSKYIYGLRWASCIFYGVGRMPYFRFLPLSFGSCFLWVFVLAGGGYFFSSTITNLIGDFHQLGKVLLALVVAGVVGFYLLERYWLSQKVEYASPERLHELEHAAQEKLHELGHELQERIHFKHGPARHKDEATPQTEKSGTAETDK
jgi:membrane protein DedA with SNARE-associated domain